MERTLSLKARLYRLVKWLAGQLWVSALLLAALVLLAGCATSSDSEGDDGSASLSDLEGTWRGTIEYDTGEGPDRGGITVVVSGDTLSVTSPLGGPFSGRIAHEQGNIYSFEMSDGTTGGFLVDDAARHAAFLDEDESFGVVEKGASALNESTVNFSAGDFVGSWNGTTVELDSAMNITDTYASSASIDASGNVTATDKFGTYVGTASLLSAVWGVASGTLEAGTSLFEFEMFLTPDKAFGAGWGCESGFISFIADCVFFAWGK